MTAPVLLAHRLSKKFSIYKSPVDRLRDRLWPRPQSRAYEFWAIQDVNLELWKGETLGIIGRNGAGKSTLLRLLAGILTPTEGRVTARGKISTLLELGCGFHPDLSGRENVEILGILGGWDRARVAEWVTGVREFADIGDFFEMPVKYYSAGMFVRLAFAAAVQQDPDIFLIDEAIAVGDAAFQHRSVAKIQELQRKGVCIVLSTHDFGFLKTLCHRAAFIEKGAVLRVGPSEDVIGAYIDFLTSLEAAEPASPRRAREGDRATERENSFAETAEDGEGSGALLPRETAPGGAGLRRGGTGDAIVTSVQFFFQDRLVHQAVPFGALVRIRVNVEVRKNIPKCLVGVGLKDQFGRDVVNTNTHEEGIRLADFKKGEKFSVDFVQNLPIKPGLYSVTAAVAYDNRRAFFADYVDSIAWLQILEPANQKIVHGMVDLDTQIVVHRGEDSWAPGSLIEASPHSPPDDSSER